jgi:hypothetical protein
MRSITELAGGFASLIGEAGGDDAHGELAAILQGSGAVPIRSHQRSGAVEGRRHGRRERRSGRGGGRSRRWEA